MKRILLTLIFSIVALVFTFIYYHRINNSSPLYPSMEISWDLNVHVVDMQINVYYSGLVEMEFITDSRSPGKIKIMTNDLYTKPEADLPTVKGSLGERYKSEEIEVDGELTRTTVRYGVKPKNRNSAIINSTYFFLFDNIKTKMISNSHRIEEESQYLPDADNFALRFIDFSFVDLSNVTPQPDKRVGHTMVFDQPETITAMMNEGVYIAGYDFVQNNKNQSIIFFLGIIIGAVLSLMTSIVIDKLLKM